MPHDIDLKKFKKSPQFDSLKIDPKLCNEPITAHDSKMERRYKEVLCPTRFKGEKGL